MSRAISFTVVCCCLGATILALSITTARASVVGDFLGDGNAIEEGNSFGAARLALGRLSAPGGRRRQPVEQCNSCGPNQCQVMGMQRYAEPVCDLLGGVGSPCRMWQEPENKTLHFPNKILHCNDVYMQFCPCSGGLVCEEAECRLPSGGGSSNGGANSNNQNDAYNLYELSATENDVSTGNPELATGRLDENVGEHEEETTRTMFQQHQQQQPERRYSRGPQWSAQHLWNLNRYY